MTPQQVKQRAARRLVGIAYAAKRIKRKIKENQKPDRNADYEKRLEEYDLSIQALKLELRTGKPMRIGGADGENDTVIDVPAGDLSLEGK